jgi:hypothetical protein
MVQPPRATCTATLLRFDPPDRRTCRQLSPDARSDGSSTRPDRDPPVSIPYPRLYVLPTLLVTLFVPRDTLDN